MVARLYFNKSIVELERLFADAQAIPDLSAIRLVYDEVNERKTSRAKALRQLIGKSLQEQSAPSGVKPPMN